MADEADVGLVDAHAEGDGGGHHHTILLLEGVLVGVALRLVETGMIGQRIDAGGLQRLGQFLDLAARGTVDDAALGLVAAHEGEHLARGALLGLEGQPEIGPVEASHEDARRHGEQLVDDVVAGRRIGGRGEGESLQPAADLPRHVAQAEIFGAKIVAPLRDAVGLVDRHHRDVALGQHLDRVGPRQPFGRDIEQPELAPAQQAHHAGILGRLVAGVQAAGRNPGRRERPHLVAHQGDQRRHNQGQAGPGDGGKLVAQRLAAAGRHDGQHVLARQHGVDDLFLAGSISVETEDRMQQGRCVGARIEHVQLQ